MHQTSSSSVGVILHRGAFKHPLSSYGAFGSSPWRCVGQCSCSWGRATSSMSKEHGTSIRLDAVGIGHWFEGGLGKSCGPQPGRKRGNWGRRVWVRWHPLRHPFCKPELLLLRRWVLSSSLGAWGRSESRTDGRIGIHRGCVSSGNPQFSSSALFFSLCKKEWLRLTLACLKHRIVRWWGEMHEKNRKQEFGLGVTCCRCLVITGAWSHGCAPKQFLLGLCAAAGIDP